MYYVIILVIFEQIVKKYYNNFVMFVYHKKRFECKQFLIVFWIIIVFLFIFCKTTHMSSVFDDVYIAQYCIYTQFAKFFTFFMNIWMPKNFDYYNIFFDIFRIWFLICVLHQMYRIFFHIIYYLIQYLIYLFVMNAKITNQPPYKPHTIKKTIKTLGKPKNYYQKSKPTFFWLITWFVCWSHKYASELRIEVLQLVWFGLAHYVVMVVK